VLIASILLYGVLSIATMLSSSISALLVARFATGVGLGGALPAVIAIAVESAPPSRREFAVGLLLAGPPIGGALVSLLAAILAAPDHWTSIYLVGGLLPILVVAPALLMFLPKPPDVANSAGADPQTSVIATLFASGRATQTIAIWAAFFTMLLVLFIFLGWLPTLLVSRGMIPRDAFLVQMAFNLGAIPGSILAGYMFGRRTFRNTALIGFFLVSGLTFLLLGGGPTHVSFVIATGMLAGVSVTGAQVIIYALAPGINSTSGRATGVGFCVAAGRIGSAVGPLLVALMISKHFAPAQILYALIPIFAISGALAFFVSLAISISGDDAAMETFP
jgi:AAHS family 3-hydroxyphenylpropionic acid transporter